MELFDGYLKTKNKKCIDKYKNVPASELRSFDEVKSLSEYAGRLAPDTVLIDIDDAEQAEILMDIVEKKQLDCKVIQTTRGKHFYFKNDGSFNKCGTHRKLACGLTADIKIGQKSCYGVLKFDGKKRFCEWDAEDGKTYQAAPKFLLPIHSSADFMNMEEGDGRDSALYAYILNLQSLGLTKDEAIECIHIINDHILKDKMTNADIERITRDEAFLKPIFFSDKGTFMFDAFAQFMKSEHHIKRINGQLHMFKDGIYVPGYAEIESAMIQHIPTLNRARRKEVLDYLEILIREETPATDARWIAFSNGLLDIQTDEFVDFTPDVIITNIIPFDYNKNAYDELTDVTLNRISCNDTCVRKLLEEMAGYCLYRRNELGKAFILTGSGSNGKSTYLNMIKHMLGKRNISVLDMKKLNDRFSTVMMYGKLANIGDDISDNFLDDSSEFKKIVTGETIDAEQKGQPKFEFDPYVKLIFSANNIPRIGKGRDSSAVIRRLVIIPFNAKFTSSDPDYVPFIGDKLKKQEAIEYLIMLGIEGLKRVLLNKQFTTSEKVQKEIEEFEEMNNPVLGFFRENSIDDVSEQITNDVYKNYNEYCIVNGMTPMAKGEFSKQCKKYYNLEIIDKRINGQKFRIFVKG